MQKLVNTIVTQMDDGLCCDGLLLDLAKASYTVFVQILLRKLEWMGIREIALK